ncbi:GAP1-N2 domain-containing protein [Sinosporangium siamense]|uniref:Uncharacterized protein n=1 Tax=Sinosporangium siamense TaxID=1367973 RepID=A0A919RPQ6_9ACTN|nr:hypothetical protein [Sinosporangium siamense]GII96755.1 hypothetical protein Ssi02_69860 [Sinosporangium siamense]
MAWQLHYTSAEAGPTGRAGFQFTAASPGLPDGAAAQVAPYLSYRPPPSAPTAPSAAQIGAMPAAMAYGPAGERFALARCVYLGQDYSGRFGNFLGHALVLEEDDLVGLRPIELWRAPLWADSPGAPGSALPVLDDLPPGPVLDPESVGLWLRSGGPAAYHRLGALLELSRRALVGGHGRLLLVAADVEEIVRWIAALSYSFPWEVVRRLTFVTYSGDPASAPQIVIGTTPDVWLPADLDAAVVMLDRAAAPVELGRFAATAVELWRAMNLDGLDELGAFGPADPETAAALVTLCVSGGEISPQEQEAVAGLLAAPVPEWVWSALGEQAHRLGPVLAAAAVEHGPPEAADPCAARLMLLALRDPDVPVPTRRLPGHHVRELVEAACGRLRSAAGLADLSAVLRVADRGDLPLPAGELARATAVLVVRECPGLAEEIAAAPPRWREPLVDGLIDGLERTPPDVRARLLTPQVRGLLDGMSLESAPLTLITVIRALFAAGMIDRAGATEGLIRLPPSPGVPAEREAALAGVWRERPKAEECRHLLAEWGGLLRLSPTLSAVPARVFTHYGVTAAESRSIARAVLEAGVPDLPVGDAEAVLIVMKLPELRAVERIVKEVERLTRLTERADAGFAGAVHAAAAKVLTRCSPAVRATLLRRLDDDAQDWLLASWLAAKHNRDEQAALLEIAIRLRRAGADIPRLAGWAHDLVNGWTAFTSLEGRFKKDPDLAAGLKEFTRSRWPKWGRR